ELLLGAGGFGLVVLDVGSGRGEDALWPRLARAAERTGATLLAIARRRHAGAFAAVGLEVVARRGRRSGGPGRRVPVVGVDARIAVVRSRIGRTGQALVVRQRCG